MAPDASRLPTIYRRAWKRDKHAGRLGGSRRRQTGRAAVAWTLGMGNLGVHASLSRQGGFLSAGRPGYETKAFPALAIGPAAASPASPTLPPMRLVCQETGFGERASNRSASRGVPRTFLMRDVAERLHADIAAHLCLHGWAVCIYRREPQRRDGPGGGLDKPDQGSRKIPRRRGSRPPSASGTGRKGYLGRQAEAGAEHALGRGHVTDLVDGYLALALRVARH